MHFAAGNRTSRQSVQSPHALLDNRWLPSSPVSVKRALVCCGLEGRPGIHCSGVAAWLSSVCADTSSPQATFILIVVLKLAGTKSTKTQCWKRYPESAHGRDKNKTPIPHLLPLTLETEQLAVTDLDIRVLLRRWLREHGAPVCSREDSGWSQSKLHLACTAQQSSLPSTQGG